MDLCLCNMYYVHTCHSSIVSIFLFTLLQCYFDPFFQVLRGIFRQTSFNVYLSTLKSEFSFFFIPKSIRVCETLNTVSTKYKNKDKKSNLNILTEYFILKVTV